MTNVEMKYDRNDDGVLYSTWTRAGNSRAEPGTCPVRAIPYFGLTRMAHAYTMRSDGSYRGFGFFPVQLIQGYIAGCEGRSEAAANETRPLSDPGAMETGPQHGQFLHFPERHACPLRPIELRRRRAGSSARIPCCWPRPRRPRLGFTTCSRPLGWAGSSPSGTTPRPWTRFGS